MPSRFSSRPTLPAARASSNGPPLVRERRRAPSADGSGPAPEPLLAAPRAACLTGGA
ncbi:hypothetical protein FTUN_3918 [Frigoriglobus tundricola]|uniref:Uncharacterized protein n=1 Tax=Frigoriglobus tundricola TaxID=2774151 RepID=A0A6M5YSU0_9BACT|nr:hypothetical protein FTUN_3918 [Frigoriglobus tundricola]